LLAVLITLAAGEPLDAVYNDHPLKGKYAGCRECHITPDWLLIYKISDDSIFLFLTRTGAHADLF
jgi:mRNA interferase YafQ